MPTQISNPFCQSCWAEAVDGWVGVGVEVDVGVGVIVGTAGPFFCQPRINDQILTHNSCSWLVICLVVGVGVGVEVGRIVGVGVRVRVGVLVTGLRLVVPPRP